MCVCVCVYTIVNSDATNMGVRTSILNPLGYMLGMELLGHMVALCLTF